MFVMRAGADCCHAVSNCHWSWSREVGQEQGHLDASTFLG
jgi:hypothetical protein